MDGRGWRTISPEQEEFLVNQNLIWKETQVPNPHGVDMQINPVSKHMQSLQKLHLLVQNGQILMGTPMLDSCNINGWRWTSACEQAHLDSPPVLICLLTQHGREGGLYWTKKMTFVLILCGRRDSLFLELGCWKPFPSWKVFGFVFLFLIFFSF